MRRVVPYRRNPVVSRQHRGWTQSHTAVAEYVPPTWMAVGRRSGSAASADVAGGAPSCGPTIGGRQRASPR